MSVVTCGKLIGLLIGMEVIGRLRWYTESLVSKKGETPADSKCEEYKAACGFSGQSWEMPAQGIKATSTHAFRYPEGKTLCPTCFPSSASRA